MQTKLLHFTWSARTLSPENPSRNLYGRQGPQLPDLPSRVCRIGANDVAREADIERDGRLEELDLFLRQANRQRLDIIHQVFDLATTHDGEHVRRFGQDIRQCNSRDGLDTVLSRNRGQRLGYTTFGSARH